MMVIQICIKDLRDFDRAENYCEELHFGLSDQWAAQQCAQKIFELYLRDPECVIFFLLLLLYPPSPFDISQLLKCDFFQIHILETNKGLGLV